MAIDEGDLDARGARGVHGDDRQQTTGGVVVVVQGRDEDGAALRQDRRVIFGDGGLARGRHDLDTDDAQRRRNAVGHGVGEGVGARLSRPKVDGSVIQVGLDRGAGGCTGDGRQGQMVAVRVGVILERIERDGLARVRLEEVAVRRRRQVSGLLDVDDQLAAGLRALVVSDRENDRLRAGCSAFLGDGDGAVFGEGGLQPLGSLGVLQVDGVAIGVTPIAESLVLDLSARADLDGRDAQLRRSLVLIEGVNGNAHVGLGRSLAVGSRVGKRRRADLRGRHSADLQGSSAARDGHDAPLGLLDRRGGQHVTIEIGVVVEDGQDGRASRADAELVVLGLGRGVFLALLRVRNLVRQLGAVLLILVFLELVFDLVPVIHEDHVRVGQPHAALGDVIEDDGLAVRAEDDLARGRQRINDHLLVHRRIVAGAHVRTAAGPRAIRAAFVTHGRGRSAADATLGGGRDRRGAARQRDRHERGGRGEQDGIGLGACLLEDAAGLDAGSAQIDPLVVGQEERVGLAVEGDDLVADDGHAQSRVRGDTLNGRGLGLIDRALTLDGRQRARGGQGIDGAVQTGHEGAGTHVRGDGRRLGKVQGAGVHGGGRPQGTVGAIEDAEDVATLHDRGTRGQGRRGAEGDLGNVDGCNRRRGEVGDGDSLPRLADVEVGGLGAQRAVEDAGLVVEVADHLLGLVGHPDAAVVDVDLGHLRALVDDTRDAERNNEQHEDERRQTAPRTDPIVSRFRGHMASLDR